MLTPSSAAIILRTSADVGLAVNAAIQHATSTEVQHDDKVALPLSLTSKGYPVCQKSILQRDEVIDQYQSDSTWQHPS